MPINNNFLNLLPPEVIILIMSRLSILEAVTVCSFLTVMNQNLWSYSRVFEIDETHFIDVERRRELLHTGRLSWATQIKRVGRRRFVEFVNNHLPNLVSPIIRFSIRFSYQPEYTYLIQSWLMLALAGKPEELILDFSDRDPLMAVPFIYQSLFILPQFLSIHGGSIGKMSLRACYLESFSFHSFTSLTNLVLKHVVVTKREIVNLGIYCPLLEVLSLLDCRRLTKIKMTIPAFCLQRLVVMDCESLELIEISAPRLRSFEYSGDSITFRFRNLNSIEYVGLNFWLDTLFHYGSLEVIDHLQSFTRAKIIKLCSFVFKIYPTDYPLWERAGNLVNLEHLSLKTCSGAYELPGIYFILGCLPNLKTLNILNLYRDLTAFTDSYFPCIPDGHKFEKRLPLDHLKKVQVTNFTGSENEINLLKVLLKDAVSLEKLIISPGDAEMRIDIRSQDGVEIASPCLQIILN